MGGLERMAGVRSPVLSDREKSQMSEVPLSPTARQALSSASRYGGAGDVGGGVATSSR